MSMWVRDVIPRIYYLPIIVGKIFISIRPPPYAFKLILTHNSLWRTGTSLNPPHIHSMSPSNIINFLSTSFNKNIQNNIK